MICPKSIRMIWCQFCGSFWVTSKPERTPIFLLYFTFFQITDTRPTSVRYLNQRFIANALWIGTGKSAFGKQKGRERAVPTFRD
jgi:hypothetical protein